MSSSLFSQQRSQCDFSEIDIGLLEDRAQELDQQQWRMKKKVNQKVINMINKCVLAATPAFKTP
jgi:hypothetical protein